jgi:hypothetical protein
MGNNDRKTYFRLLAGLTEKERECLELLHSLYEEGRFAVACGTLMEELVIDYEQYTAVAEKMLALRIASWTVSPKRATPKRGGLYIKSDIRRVWRDLCEQRKRQMHGGAEWEGQQGG